MYNTCLLVLKYCTLSSTYFLSNYTKLLLFRCFRIFSSSHIFVAFIIYVFPSDLNKVYYRIKYIYIQGAAERTPRFGRGIASGGERLQCWGARRRTAVYVPFSVYTMACSGEHRTFIVEEFIKKRRVAGSSYLLA